MGTITQALLRDALPGDIQELPKAGSALEHPLVYDAVARDLKTHAERGEVEIVAENKALIDDEWLIDRLSFRKI